MLATFKHCPTKTDQSTEDGPIENVCRCFLLIELSQPDWPQLDFCLFDYGTSFLLLMMFLLMSFFFRKKMFHQQLIEYYSSAHQFNC